MNRLSMEVPIFLKFRMLWNGPLRNLATQPVSWPVKISVHFFFFNIVRKIDAFMFLDVVIVIFVICRHFDSLIDILTNATSSFAMSL
jgi:hypothetical protein